MKKRLYQNSTENIMQLRSLKRKNQNHTFSGEEVGKKNYIPPEKRKYSHGQPHSGALSLLSDIALGVNQEPTQRRLKKRKKHDINDQIQKHDGSSNPYSNQVAGRRINTTSKDCIPQVKVSHDTTSAPRYTLPATIPGRQFLNSSSIEDQSSRVPIPPKRIIDSEQKLNHSANNLVDTTYMPGAVQTPPVTSTNTVNSPLCDHIVYVTGTTKQNIEDSLKNSYTHQVLYYNLLLQRFILQPDLYLKLGLGVHLQELNRQLTLAPGIHRMHDQPKVQNSTLPQRGAFFSTRLSQNLRQRIQPMEEVNSTTTQRFKKKNDKQFEK